MNLADKTAALFAPDEIVALFGQGDKDRILTLDVLRYLGMLENRVNWQTEPMGMVNISSGFILSY